METNKCACGGNCSNENCACKTSGTCDGNCTCKVPQQKQSWIKWFYVEYFKAYDGKLISKARKLIELMKTEKTSNEELEEGYIIQKFGYQRNYYYNSFNKFTDLPENAKIFNSEEEAIKIIKELSGNRTCTVCHVYRTSWIWL